MIFTMWLKGNLEQQCKKNEQERGKKDDTRRKNEKKKKKGQDNALCLFKTTNEDKNDWTDLNVAPMRSHVTRFINPFKVYFEKFHVILQCYTDFEYNDVNIIMFRT